MRKLPLQDETLRKILAVELPATYREHLCHPANGPKTAKLCEKDITEAEKVHDVVIGEMLNGVEWKDYLAISEDSAVDLCIRNLIEDSTEDNAVCTVRAILDVFRRMKLS